MTDTSTLRWGLLGTARINRRIIPAIRANTRANLVAVASRDLARARAYAREWDIPRAYGSYHALLRDDAVDAVYIGLPNALHVEWTLRALERGKHVLCEKPLALDPQAVERIAVTAGARGRIVAEAFMYRHEPLTDRTLGLVADGAIGPLQSITVSFTYRRSRDHDVRLIPDLGGGCLWDVGCYAVGYARLIAGVEPREVFGWASWGPSGVDEAFTGLLRFADGLIATVHASFHSDYRHWADIAGIDAAMRVGNPFKPARRDVIELRRGDLVQSVPVDGSAELFVRQVDDFVASALDGAPSRVSLADSRGNAAALAALYQSARSGRPVGLVV